MSAIKLSMAELESMLRGEVIDRVGGPDLKIRLSDDINFSELKRIILLIERDALDNSHMHNVSQ